MCQVTSIFGLRGLIDMCGRFALNENPLKFAEHFNLSGDVDFSPSWNIAPSSRICTITADGEGSRHLHKMRGRQLGGRVCFHRESWLAYTYGGRNQGGFGNQKCVDRRPKAVGQQVRLSADEKTSPRFC